MKLKEGLEHYLSIKIQIKFVKYQHFLLLIPKFKLFNQPKMCD